VERVGRMFNRAAPGVLGVAVCVYSFVAVGRPPFLSRVQPLDVYWHNALIVAGVLGVGCGVGALLARRWRWPLAVFAVLGWLTFGMWPALMALSYYAARTLPRRPLIGYTVAAAALVYVPVAVSGMAWNALFGLAGAAVFIGLPELLGLWVNARRALLAEARERAERLEREQAARADRARAEERARIAREMHDVVAHRVSLMVLHAGALEVNAPDGDIAAAAALIRQTGRSALADLRETLGVLRSGRESLAPPPTLAELDRLLDESRALGMPVSVAGSCPTGLPESLQRAAYRVVQEALTNVHKHAADAATTVTVSVADDVLEVSVRNAAPPGVVAGTVPGTVPGSGLGLVGLRERVTLLGGSFSAAPLLDGGFGITARLPVADGFGDGS
jgi:signal transduction histidine kinase